MTEAKRCEVCDRADCPLEPFRKGEAGDECAMSDDEYAVFVDKQDDAARDCHAHRVDWPARARAAESKLDDAERATAEAIATWLDDLRNTSRAGAIIKVENRTIELLAEWVRSGAWRKP